MATYSDHAQRELDQQSGRELDRIAARRARWPANKVPGRTPEEIAAATTATIIAPNAEAMRLELAKRR